MSNKNNEKHYLLNHPISKFLDVIQPENVNLKTISANAHSPELNWVCSRGHKFKKTPNRVAQSYKRFGTINCEYCSNKKAVYGKNDLETQYPNIAKEWDYTLNDASGETPRTVLSFSNKKYWWHCNNGFSHSFFAKVSDRTFHNSGCNVCDGRVVVSGFNDIDTLCPEAKVEWSSKNEKNSSQVSIGEHTKYYWLCKNGHETLQSPNQRIREGKFLICPICQKSRHTSFPEKAILYYVEKYFSNVLENNKITTLELDVYVPDSSFAVEYDGSAYHGEQKKKTDIRKDIMCKEKGITLFRIREKGCPYLPDNGQKVIDICNNPSNESLSAAIICLFHMLSQNKLINIVNLDINVERDEKEIIKRQQKFYAKDSIENDNFLLSTWNYEKNKEILGLTPASVSYGYSRKVFWKCKTCGYEWEQTPAEKKNVKYSCPMCENRFFNKDFEEKYPNVAIEWDFEKNVGAPSDYSYGSGYMAHWICKKNKNHKWTARISDRTLKDSGCPYCKHSIVLQNETSLAVLYPKLMNEWDWERNTCRPENFLPSSKTVVWWNGPCGHNWDMSIVSRTGKKPQSCPYCSGKRVLIGFNDFPSINPQAFMEWDWNENTNLNPYDFTASSMKIVSWICSNNPKHKWKASIASRKKHNCPFCSGNKVFAGENDLETLFPEIASEWCYEKNYPLTPRDVTHSSNREVWWKGKCGHIWPQRIGARTSSQKQGCPYCSGRKVLKGFNDLSTTYPEVAAQWNYEKNGENQPSAVTYGSHKLIYWNNQDGSISYLSVKNRVNNWKRKQIKKD